MSAASPEEPNAASRPTLPPMAAWADASVGELRGVQLDAVVPPVPSPPADVPTSHSHPTTMAPNPRRRRVLRPALLFVATCLSTFFAGATDWLPFLVWDSPELAWALVARHWQEGLIYMTCVIGILLMHEMGHFVQTVRYGIPASLPFFLPVPMVLTGTMGAVIAMEGSRADRKQLFDIGVTGPWAGLAVALPVIWWGIYQATYTVTSGGGFELGDPLIFKLMQAYVRPDIPRGAVLHMNAPLMAGWVGMLVTGLNMLPISQLDGGHVIYGLFGRRSRWVARSFLIAAIAFIVIAEQYNWSVMLILVILIGVDHPPTRDDRVPLGRAREAIGWISLAIPVFCFTPYLIL